MDHRHGFRRDRARWQSLRSAVLFVLATTSLLACTTDELVMPDTAGADGGADGCQTATSGHVLPIEVTDPPVCGKSIALSLPDGLTPDAAGGLSLQPSGFMQPIGELEHVAVMALTATGAVDVDAGGSVAVKLPAGVELVKSEPLVAGRGAVIVRVNSSGGHDIEAALGGDPRIGKVRLFGYASELPTWRLEVDEAKLLDMYAKVEERVWINGTLDAAGDKHSVKLRLHGGSSRQYPKKSLRMNLLGSAMSNGDTKVVLRAEWRDKTMLRLWLAHAVVSELAGLPAPELRFIHLRRSDGRYMGLYVRAERVDARFLERRGRNAFGDLFEADPPFELAVPGGNLTPLPDLATYTKVYQFHAGQDGYQPLLELIEEILGAPGEAGVDLLQEKFKVDALLAYLAAMTAIQNQDHVKKNYYLYRDSDGPDCRWEMLAWDLDLSFGHLWTPDKELLGEAIITDGTPTVGVNIGSLFYNQLFDRVLTRPAWLAIYKLWLGKIVARLDEPFISRRIEHALCSIAPDLLADRRKRASNAELAGRIEELRVFVKQRGAFLSQWLAQ